MLLTAERSQFSGVALKVQIYQDLEAASATCIFQLFCCPFNGLESQRRCPKVTFINWLAFALNFD